MDKNLTLKLLTVLAFTLILSCFIPLEPSPLQVKATPPNPQPKVFGNPSLPNWLNITVTEDVDFVVVDNADGFVFKFRTGASGYNEIWQNGSQIIANEQWILEYLLQSNWKQRGTPRYVTWEQPQPYHVVVTRFYTDFAETTFNVTYRFYGGFRPKITFDGYMGQTDTYRIQWKISGINKTHVSENVTKHHVRFWNEGEEAVVFDYSDVYESFGDITRVEIEQWANNHKLNEIFNVGPLPVGLFELDPKFGCETFGGDYSVLENKIKGSAFTCSGAGTADNITVGLHWYEEAWSGKIKCAIYTYSITTLTFVNATEERTISLTNTPTWYTFNFITPKASLTANTKYVLFAWAEEKSGYAVIAMVLGGDDPNQGQFTTETYNGFPSSIPYRADQTMECSIYCTYTAPANTAPTNEGVTISNMDDTNYLYSMKRDYTFVSLHDDTDDPTTIDHAMVGFTDGTNWINATFDQQTDSWSLVSGGTVASLTTGSCTNSTSGDRLTVTFYIVLWWNISDASNIELYQFCNDTDGASDPWEEKQTNYANIETDLSVSGFTCDDDRGDKNQSITFTGTIYYEGTSTYPPDASFTAVHIYDSSNNDEGNDATIVNGAFSVTFNAPASVGTDTYNAYIDMAHASYTDTEDANTDTFVTDNLLVTFTVNTTDPPKTDAVLFTVTLTRESDSTNVTSFSYSINRNGTGFNNPHVVVTFTDTNSTEVAYVYDFTAVTDNLYDITSFTDPSDLTITWTRDYPTIGDFLAPSRIYGNDYGLLNATIVDQDNNITAGTISFVNCTLHISGGIIFKWDNVTGVFSIYQDPKGYATLNMSACSRTTINVTAYRLSWSVKFGGGYSEATKGVIATNTLVYDNTTLSASGSKSNYFYYDTEDTQHGGFVWTPTLPKIQPENITWGIAPYTPPYITPEGVPVQWGLYGLIAIVVGVMVLGLGTTYTTKKPQRSTKKRTRQKRASPHDYEKRTKRKR